MSERAVVQQNKEAKAFEAFALHTDKHYDPGIAEFHRAAVRAEQLLRDSEMDADTAEGLLDELNLKWPFHGQDITVAGRLYVCGDIEHIEEYILEALGTRKLDKWGEYFEVEDTTLVSMGVIDASATGDDSSEPSIVYAYGLDEEDAEPTFIARLSDIHKAEYPYSTYEGCVARLKYEYPAIYADIMRLITPNVYDMNKLNNSLHYLVQTYPEICQDDRLGTWVSVFITRRANFDKHTTYTFTMEGEMMLPDDNGDETVYSIVEPYTFDAKIMSIGFGTIEREGEGDEAVASYLLALPSGIKSGSEHLDSQAILPVNSVITIEPRRPVLSVREQLERAQLDKVRPALAHAGLVKLADTEMPALNHDDEGEETEVPITKRERWTMLQTQLEDMISKVKQARSRNYPAAEAAQIMAQHLVNEFYTALGDFSDTLYKTLIEVGGRGVSVPSVKLDRARTESEDIITVRTDLDGMRNPGISHEVRGTLITLAASVQKLEDDTYKPAVFMSIEIGNLTRNIDIIAFEELPLAKMFTSQAALVNLDGTATVEVSGLKHANRREEILREFHKMCRAKQATREFVAIRALDKAIHRELDSMSIPLENIALLGNLHDVMRSTEHVDDVAHALNAIIGGGRMLVLNGNFIDKDGQVIVAENYVTFCVDVVHTLPFSDERMPSLVVMPTGMPTGTSETPMHYVPLHSITALHY